jgi:hypothetical protein
MPPVCPTSRSRCSDYFVMQTYNFLRQIAPEQWERFGIHAERGRITIRDLAVHIAGHDANHVEQIRRILG